MQQHTHNTFKPTRSELRDVQRFASEVECFALALASNGRFPTSYRAAAAKYSARAFSLSAAVAARGVPA